MRQLAFANESVDFVDEIKWQHRNPGAADGGWSFCKTTSRSFSESSIRKPEVAVVRKRVVVAVIEYENVPAIIPTIVLGGIRIRFVDVSVVLGIQRCFRRSGFFVPRMIGSLLSFVVPANFSPVFPACL